MKKEELLEVLAETPNEVVESVVLDSLAQQINDWAARKGFNTTPLDNFLTSAEEAGFILLHLKTTKLMLVVTELAEAVEGLRKPVASSLEGFTNEEEEIADAIIRLFHYAGQFKLRLGDAVLAKMAKNEGRPYKHGKAF